MCFVFCWLCLFVIVLLLCFVFFSFLPFIHNVLQRRFLCFSPSAYKLIFASLSLTVFALYCVCSPRRAHKMKYLQHHSRCTELRREQSFSQVTHTNTLCLIGTISQMLSQSSCLAMILGEWFISLCLDHINSNLSCDGFDS